MSKKHLVRSRSVFFGSMLSIIAVLSIFAASVTHAETSVNAIVCGADSAPTVQITSPLSDSTIASTQFGVSGTVALSGQLIVNIDGQYDQTVALQSSQTQFSFDVATVPGTHTVAVKAIGLCGGESTDDAVVVTVSPDANVSPPATIQPIAGDDAQSETIPDRAKGAIIDGATGEKEPLSSLGNSIEADGLKDKGFVTTSDAVIAAAAEATLAVKVYAIPLIFVLSTTVIIMSIISSQGIAAFSSQFFNVHRRLLLFVGIIGVLLSLIIGA